MESLRSVVETELGLEGDIVRYQGRNDISHGLERVHRVRFIIGVFDKANILLTSTKSVKRKYDSFNIRLCRGRC